MNPIEKIPEHLQIYIASQDPSLYTPIDQASWRFILRISKDYFKSHAHPHYLEGLKETGISTDRIPLISEMDGCLRKFGWRAVAVSGFIPPAIFMEFHSLRILPIACDMRKLENIAYTPAPDIVHEAAGHAPFLADPKYNEYLTRYGDIAKKAIFSKSDMDVYNAIRDLSDTKERPDATDADVERAQKRLDQAVTSSSYMSEATLLSRMYWWTVEYGLVGSVDAPKIYGAGLLSSVGESYHYLDAKVQKIPFTLDAVQMSYDITRPQPQLFVAPHFDSLIETLENFADTMAFRQGGLAGLTKAVTAKTVTTSVYDSELEVSGVLEEVVLDPQGSPAYLRFVGPCQLSRDGNEIAGQGTQRHAYGFGCPVGRIAHLKKGLHELNEAERQSLNLVAGGKTELKFESGLVIRGHITEIHTHQKTLLIITLTNCQVTYQSRILFDPEWGEYDLACGGKITSVFGGPADPVHYQKKKETPEALDPIHKTNLTAKNKELNLLYFQVRTLRESNQTDAEVTSTLEKIAERLVRDFTDDWLLVLEILEINHERTLNLSMEDSLRKQLAHQKKSSSVVSELIHRGLSLIQ